MLLVKIAEAALASEEVRVLKNVLRSAGLSTAAVYHGWISCSVRRDLPGWSPSRTGPRLLPCWGPMLQRPSEPHRPAVVVARMSL